MQEKKTIQNNLIDPLKDKGRTMKLEHLLSNRYSIRVILILADLGLLFGWTYLLHLLGSIPSILMGKARQDMFSLKYLFPSPSALTVGKVFSFLFAAAILDIYLYYKIKTSWSEDHFNVGQKGTSRFTYTEEIQEEYKAIAPLEDRYPGNPGILIARIGNTFYIDDMVVNNLILGITRSGKGETLVKSSIEIYSRAEFQPSLLINDPKLEHYKVFAPVLREERGYDVYLLNVSNPKLSMGFNLVFVALFYYKKKDYDMAEQVANSLAYSYFDVEKAKGDMRYFVSAAAALFTAMVLASMEDAIQADEEENQTRYEKWRRLPEESKKKHPFRYRNENEKTINLYSMLINFGQLVTIPVDRAGTRTLLDEYFSDRPANDRARMKYLGVEVAPGKTKSGVFSEMLRELDIFTLKNVASMTAESSLDFAEIGFGKKPVAIFLATPSYDSSLYKIPTIFIRQMYYVLGKMCDDGKGKCDRQVKVIFDEKGNMPSIEMMKVMTTMGLGQNISFDLYLQNYEQLDDLYGPEIAKTIKGNCGNHFYLQTSSEDTAKSFSNMLGPKSIIDVQRAGGKLSLNKYFTESIQEKPLLNMNQLMELQEGEIVIIRRSKRRDLKGRKIKPRPIYNSVENDRYLWYAYEYFPKEKFPDPNQIDFLTVCKESREHIELDERVWDIEKSWRMMERTERRRKCLKDASDYPELKRVLRDMFGPHLQEQYGICEETTVPEFTAFVNEQEITEVEKEVLLDMLG